MAEEAVTAPNRLEPEPVATSMLCYECFPLLYEEENVHELVFNNTTMFHRKWDDLETGGEKGCQLCVLITSSVRFRIKRMGMDESIIANPGQQMTFRLRRRARDQKLPDLEDVSVEVRVPDEEHWQWEQLENVKVAAIESIII
jgi:hypothetical protein